MAQTPNPKRRHHYVPQFYLRHFTIPPDFKYLATLKKSDGGSFSGVAPKNIALENDFHTIAGDSSLEDKLAELESEWSAIHNILVDKKNPEVLSPVERQKYSEFMGFQLSRTVQFRNWLTASAKVEFSKFISPNPEEKQRKTIKNVTSIYAEALENIDAEQLVESKLWDSVDQKYYRETGEHLVQMVQGIKDEIQNELIKASESGILPEKLRKYDQRAEKLLTDRIKKKHVEEMNDFAIERAHRIEKMQWAIIHNHSNIPFITSDNPVCVTVPQNFKKLKLTSNKDKIKWVLNMMGLAQWDLQNNQPNRNITIQFPLNPRLLLIAGYTNSNKGTLEHVRENGKLVAAFNNISVFQAREFLFSSSDDFSHVETIQSSNDLTKLVNDILENIIKNNYQSS